MEVKFKIGDKLEPLDYHKIENGLEYVTITSINMKNELYHWEADCKKFGLKLCSGYFFNETKEYKK